MIRKIHLLAVLTAACIITTTILSQSQQQPQPGQTGQNENHRSVALSNSDRDFVMKAAEGGKHEAAMAEMAASRASNEEVKSYAQRLVTDHQQANQELATLASSKGIQLKSDSEIQQQHSGNKTHQKLSSLNGADFDREFMKTMLKEHRKDIEMFEKQSRNGRDTDIKAFADKTLPTLRQHLQLGRDVAAKVGVTDTATN